jgi:hypothetical protein
MGSLLAPRSAWLRPLSLGIHQHATTSWYKTPLGQDESRSLTSPISSPLIRALERFPYNGGMALLSGRLRRSVARLNSRGHRRSAHKRAGMCLARPVCLARSRHTRSLNP